MKDKFGLLAAAFIITVTQNVALADFDKVTITNFNAQYKYPEGSATAEVFDLPPAPPQYPESVEMRFFRRESAFIFDMPGRGEVEWKNPPSEVFDVENFSVNGFNLKSAGNKADLSLGAFEGLAKKGETRVRTAQASCTENPSPLTGQEKILDSCTTNASATVANIYMKNQKQNQLIGAAIFGLDAEVDPTATETTLKNLSINVRNHAFNLQVTASMGLQAVVKMDGQAHYLASEKRLRIRLDNAKAGFLNIKEQIFKSVEDGKQPNVSVVRPYIYIKLEAKPSALAVSN